MIIHSDKRDFSGYTAILAAPSVGNTSQLCLDLIISTLKATYFGMIWHEAVLQLVGADPYDEKSSKICTSNDVYYSEKHKILLIQFRAPLQKDCQSNYLLQLTEYLKNLNIEQFIVLAGLFSHQRNDVEISEGTFRFITCPKANEKHGETLTSFNWTRMKENNEENGFSCPKLHGAGFTRCLFNLCCKVNIPCVVLLIFCSEGDNSFDATQLLMKLNSWLLFMPEDIKNIVYPPSWKYLFGNSVPRNIY